MPDPANPPQETGKGLFRAPVILVISVIALFLIVFLVYGLFGKAQILDRLSDISYARGLITFIIAIGTIVLFIMLGLSNLIDNEGDTEKRFTRGKELLSILIGLLGTIIGYYYGTSTDESKKFSELSVAPVLISRTGAPNEISLRTFISGGKGTYTYSIDFSPDSAKDILNHDSKDGWVYELISVKGVPKDSTLDYEIKITDKQRAVLAYKPSKEEQIKLNK